MADYKKIPISTVLKYYKRPEIQRAIVDAAEHKEIAMSYGGTGYGKRPDVLHYPRDILEMVKRGGTSFHCSEELWHNPLQVTTGMKPTELNELRKGWDLILDIDCPELEYSKIAGDLLVHALKHHGVKHISVKFSGNHGFHIGIPFEAFPATVNGKPVKDLFPDGPRRIASYLQDMIRDPLAQRLLEKHPLATIAQNIGKPANELSTNGRFNPFAVLAIDTVLIASRHLYRMPYSLNEKSGLVSTVIKPEDILTFDKNTARPELVKDTPPFLQRDPIIPGEARQLLVNAFDHNVKIEPDIEIKKKEYEPVTEAVPEEYFPPCIKTISQGLEDGRKRALFILLNFLKSVGWSYDQIETYLHQWNERNPEPLREVVINGHLRHHKNTKKKILPPNCTNKAYMVDLGVCNPDGFCKANTDPRNEKFAPRIKNPANYAVAKQRSIARLNERKPRKKKTTKQTTSQNDHKQDSPPDPHPARESHK